MSGPTNLLPVGFNQAANPDGSVQFVNVQPKVDAKTGGTDYVAKFTAYNMDDHGAIQTSNFYRNRDQLEQDFSREPRADNPNYEHNRDQFRLGLRTIDHVDPVGAIIARDANDEPAAKASGSHAQSVTPDSAARSASAAAPVAAEVRMALREDANATGNTARLRPTGPTPTF